MEIDWSPTNGDPSTMGWVTVLVYLLAAAVALKLFLSSSALFPSEVRGRQKHFWASVSAIMLFLAINKQFDLQSLFTALGRYYAQRDGWYQERGPVQLSIAMVAALCIPLGVFFFVRRLKGVLRANIAPVLGVVFVLTFVALRATSFHAIDYWVSRSVLGIRMNWVLELSGVLVVIVSGLRSIRSGQLRAA